MRALLQYTLDLFGPDDTDDTSRRAVPKEPARAQTAGPTTPQPDRAAFRHPRANREVRLCGHVVEYEFKRGKRSTIGFSVGADGLSVRAPKWVTLTDVQKALGEKASWIVRKLVESIGRAHV